MTTARLSRSGRPAVWNAARALDAVVARHAWRWAAIFSVLLLCVSILRSLRAKMWLDEFFTLYTMRQPRAWDVISAIREGCDGAPPLYALIAHVLRPVLANDVLTIRLPAAAGVCVMCVAVFAFSIRRLPAMYAFAAMLLACNASLYWASEGRSYGLVLGCAAGALLAWQAAADGRRRPLAITILAACLVAGIALHHYLIFLIIPLLAGELMRSARSGRLDWPVLIALAVSPLILIAHLPLLETARTSYRAGRWNVSLRLIPDFVSEYYFPYLLLISVPLLVFFLWRLPAGNGDNEESPNYGLRAHEWMAVAVLACLPALVVIVALLTIKILVNRWVVYAVVGFTILVIGALFRLTRGNTIVGAITLALLLGLFGVRTIQHLRGPQVLRQGQSMLDVLSDVPVQPSPIVVASCEIFMELAYYADPAVRNRLVFAVSSELDGRYSSIGDPAFTMFAVARRTPLRVARYEDFLRANPRFLLLADASDWRVWNLLSSGYRVEPIRSTLNPHLFRVEAPVTSSR